MFKPTEIQPYLGSESKIYNVGASTQMREDAKAIVALGCCESHAHYAAPEGFKSYYLVSITQEQWAEFKKLAEEG